MNEVGVPNVLVCPRALTVLARVTYSVVVCLLGSQTVESGLSPEMSQDKKTTANVVSNNNNTGQ